MSEIRYFPPEPPAGCAYVRDRHGTIIAVIDAQDAAAVAAVPGSWYVMRSSSSGFRDVVCANTRQPDRVKVYLHTVVGTAKGLQGQRLTFQDGDAFNCRRANVIPAPLQSGIRPGTRVTRPGRREYQPAGITRRHWPNDQGLDIRAIGPGPARRRDEARLGDIDPVLGFVIQVNAMKWRWALRGPVPVWQGPLEGTSYREAVFALCAAAGYETPSARAQRVQPEL
jgi:hypothetical protein